MSNYTKIYLNGLCYSIAILFTGTSVIQILLTELGIPSTSIGWYTSLLSTVNMVTNIGFSAYADRCGNLKRVIALLYLSIGGCMLLLIPLCLARGLSANTTFFLIAAVCLVQMVFITMYGVLSYKMPYSTIDIRQYGRMSAVGGIINGIASTVSSYALAEYLERYPYHIVLAVGFGVGSICAVISAVIVSTYDMSRGKALKTVSDKPEKAPVFSGLQILLKEKDFRCMILPNFCRGIHMGMLGMATVIAVSCGFDTAMAGRLVTVSFLAGIAGSAFYAVVSNRIESRKLCLIGSLITSTGIFLPFCTDTVFMAVYFIIMAGKIMIDYGVPSQIYAKIKPEIACLYQTWRLIVTTAGSIFAAAVSGYFIEYISLTGFIVIASVCQVFSGICYCRWKSERR